MFKWFKRDKSEKSKESPDAPIADDTEIQPPRDGADFADDADGLARPEKPLETVDITEVEVEETPREEPLQEEPPQEEPPQEEPQSKKRGFLARLKDRLADTRAVLNTRVDHLLLGKKEVDEDVLDDLEEILITSDLGVKTTQSLIQAIGQMVARRELGSADRLKQTLHDEIVRFLSEPETRFDTASVPHVIMVLGVNGVGKTTTIAKLARRYVQEGKKVMLVAGDTFRAAAVEQLTIWSDRVGADIVKQKSGSDPSAVVFDALQAAQARGHEVVIIDTAGRLHTNVNLMEELKKIKRVAGKSLPGSPHEILLVLDATTGQNGISQARLFQEAVGVHHVAVTKLDGTAKGGVTVAVCHELGLPIRYIGIGESMDDLRDFDAKAFVDAIFYGQLMISLPPVSVSGGLFDRILKMSEKIEAGTVFPG